MLASGRWRLVWEGVCNAPVFVLVLRVDVLHQRSGHGHDILGVDEDGLLG